MSIYPKGAGAAAAVITAGAMAASLGLVALSTTAAAQPDAARPIAAAATRSTSGTICIPTYHRG